MQQWPLLGVEENQKPSQLLWQMWCYSQNRTRMPESNSKRAGFCLLYQKVSSFFLPFLLLYAHLASKSNNIMCIQFKPCRGGSTYGPNRHRPTRPPLLDLSPPFYISWIRPCHATVFPNLRGYCIPNQILACFVLARLRSFISSVILPSSLSYVPCTVLKFRALERFPGINVPGIFYSRNFLNWVLTALFHPLANV